jgi:hypothetical protein
MKTESCVSAEQPTAQRQYHVNFHTIVTDSNTIFIQLSTLQVTNPRCVYVITRRGVISHIATQRKFTFQSIQSNADVY